MNRVLEIKDLELLTPTGQRLFFGLNLSLNAGELLHIQGKNGSGKSTLVQALLGRHSHYKGSITRNFQIDKTSYLPQLGNIQFLLPLTLQNVVNFKAEHSSEEICNFGFMDSTMLNRPWNTSSGGERQKTLLTRCLLPASDFLILDEPFNHLDGNSKNLVSKKLTEATKKGAALLIITHEENTLDFTPTHSVRLEDYIS